MAWPIGDPSNLGVPGAYVNGVDGMGLNPALNDLPTLDDFETLIVNHVGQLGLIDGAVHAMLGNGLHNCHWQRRASVWNWRSRHHGDVQCRRSFIQGWVQLGLDEMQTQHLADAQAHQAHFALHGRYQSIKA